MYNVEVVVTSPVFTNKQLSVEVSVSGVPGAAGSVNNDFAAGNINISSLTNINVSLASALVAGTVNASIGLTSSNATESIQTLTNLVADVPYRFYPAAGLKVTFVHNVAAGKPRCQGGVNLTIDGDYGEWVEIKKHNSILYVQSYGVYS